MKTGDIVECPYCWNGNEMPPKAGYLECVECGGSGRLKLQDCDIKFLKKHGDKNQWSGSSVFGIRVKNLGWLHRLYSDTATFRPKKDALKLGKNEARSHKKMLLEMNPELMCQVLALN